MQANTQKRINTGEVTDKVHIIHVVGTIKSNILFRL